MKDGKKKKDKKDMKKITITSTGKIRLKEV